MKFRLAKRAKDTNQLGFVSAQFLGLIAITLFFLSGVVQILFIEYSRQAAITAANEAARAGSQSIDFRRAFEALESTDQSVRDEAAIQIANAEQVCVERLTSAADDLLGVSAEIEEDGISCEVLSNNEVDPANATRFYMQANYSATASAFIPWAKPFADNRLKNLSAVYEQRQAAE